MHEAGVTLIVGTDSNQTNKMNFIPHGVSIHEELESLVNAGLSAKEVLKGATSIPAKTFDLPDRGVIEPGRRADLVLVKGNPIEDITATKNIAGVWIHGIPVANAGYTG